jgi:transcriptional regulator with XRE-family HTH domain
MTSARPRPRTCANPDCGKQLHQQRRGRPRQYCDEVCGKAARSARPSSTPTDKEEHRRHLRQIADDVVRNATALRDQLQYQDLSHSEWMHLLRRARDVGEDHDDLRTAMVQVTRDLDIPLARLAECWDLSPSRVSRDWPADRFASRMQRRAERKRQRARRFIPQSATATRPPGESVDPDGSSGQPETPPPRPACARPLPRGGSAARLTGDSACTAEEDPVVQFIRALSFLLRDGTSTTVTDLAQKAGLSRSHVSRILAGERFPSWRTTEALVTASGGSIDDVRSLWAAAHDAIYAGPRRTMDGTLHTVLRGLYLAAARPTADAIRSASPTLAAADITGLLEDGAVPDWHTVERLVVALRGRPEQIRPLWEDAATRRLTPGPHASGHPMPPPVSPLPAAAFG